MSKSIEQMQKFCEGQCDYCSNPALFYAEFVMDGVEGGTVKAAKCLCKSHYDEHCNDEFNMLLDKTIIGYPNGIPLLFYHNGSLTMDECRSLWNQDVTLDDWKFIILAPAELLTYDVDDETWYVEDHYVNILVNSGRDGRWYKAMFRGTEYAVGVAYHS